MLYDYIIVGNSAAAVGAIEAIRSRDAAGGILVLSQERFPAYSRPLISAYLTGERDIDEMLYRPDGFYDEKGVDLRAGFSVVSIDPEGKRVVTREGQEFAYERGLLLALGGKPGIPPIKGLDCEGIFTFTTLDDAQRIRDFLPDVRKAVVIGGGLIGLGVSEALSRIGVEVTVVEFLDQVLGPALDREAAGMVEDTFREHGVRVITGALASLVKVGAFGRAEEVLLKDGRTLPADMVVVATGVVPRKELAADAGIETNRGILVDEHMETSAPGVFAAGDVTEGYDLILGTRRPIPIWPNAYMQGRVAGACMAGDRISYPGGVAMNAAHFFGFPATSVGLFNPPQGASGSLENEYKILKSTDRARRFYRKFVIKGNRIVGMVATGDAVDRSGVITGCIRNAIDTSDFLNELFREPGLGAFTEELRAWVLNGGEVYRGI